MNKIVLYLVSMALPLTLTNVAKASDLIDKATRVPLESPVGTVAQKAVKIVKEKSKKPVEPEWKKHRLTPGWHPPLPPITSTPRPSTQQNNTNATSE